MPVLVPLLEEQREIVGALEWHNTKVHAARGRLECELKLFHEYRSRLVADVVTGKLDVREAAAGLPDLDPLAVEENPDDDSPAQR